MLYTIRHVTKFTYDTPVRESVMEVRMQPRSDGLQRCMHFGLSTTPASRVLMYQDHDGNIVHHFNTPAKHSRLTIKAEALVECAPATVLPDRIEGDGWARVDEMCAGGEHWEMRHPSTFAQPTPLLLSLFDSLMLTRGDDPLVTLRGLTSRLYDIFDYAPKSTKVDSPIDVAR